MARWGRVTRVEAWRWIAGGTIVAIAWMTVGELRRGVVPFGDNAIIEVRARDVFSRHPPLVNMLSTVASDMSVRHPGPLLFDLLAVPVRTARHGRGLFIGVGVLHATVVWTIGRTARRFLGADGAAIVAAVMAVLTWSLGRGIMTEPWQPHVTLPAFFLLLVASWGFACGSDRAAPAMVFAISFVLQTHASYLLIAPAAVLVACAMRVVVRKHEPVVKPPIVVAGALLVLLWAQPVVQQLFGGGRGNLGAVLDVAAAPHEDAVGLVDALRATSAVLAQPPFWLRPGVFARLPIAEGPVAEALGMDSTSTLMGLPGAMMCLVALAAIVVALVARARSHGDRIVVAGGAVVVASVIAGVVFITKLPIDPLLGFMVHKVRWLWPLGAFVLAFVALAALRLFAARTDAGGSRRVAVASGAVAALAMVACIPANRHEASLADRFWPLVAVSADVREHMPELEDPGFVYVPVEQGTIDEAFVATSVIAELIERGVPVRMSLRLASAQYGDQYALRGGAELTLRVTLGTATDPPEGVDVIYEGIVDLSARDRTDFFPGSGTGDIVARVTLEAFDPADVPSSATAD